MVQSTPRLAPLVALASLLALASCSDDIAEGLALTPGGVGPRIVWDLEARPLPELPLPNDVATWPDPSSPTGRRINASLLGDTSLERVLREQLDGLDGWGTYQPMTVRFRAPLNLRDVERRHRDDGFRFDDDVAYIIDLETGAPVPFDVGSGAFDYSLKDLDYYYPNDPHADASNIVFETHEEDANGNGVLDPGEDVDFDGVLDHPNTRSGREETVYDDLLTWYDRETDTLILRPMLPLRERHEYAVVLTDRLRGENGFPIRSPFATKHHPDQRLALGGLERILRRHPEYYGDLSERGWDGVTFAWTFTTQTVQTELRAIRSGLYGQGPLSWLADRYPADHVLEAALAHGGDGCDPVHNAYTVRIADVAPALSAFAQTIVGLSAEQTDALLATYDSIDHVVMTFVQSPYFLGDPDHQQLDDAFDVDAEHGRAREVADRVPVLIFVPKDTPEHHQPFPLAIYGHGTGGTAIEAFGFAGMFGAHGVATAGVTGPGHGLPLDRALSRVVTELFEGVCHRPLGEAIQDDRAEDLDGDGRKDTAGLYWTAYFFRARDSIRQDVVDWMSTIRALKRFDGHTRGTQDFDGDGTPELLGDFDADGRPDVGGPDAPYFAWGQSLGAISTMVAAGVEPSIRAAVPVSGGGGLPDLVARSVQPGVKEAIYLRLTGPLMMSVPASDYGTHGSATDRSSCANDADRSIRWFETDVTDTAETEIACLAADRLQPGDAVVLRNLSNGRLACSGVGSEGRFRVAPPADADDLVVLEIYQGGAASIDWPSCTFQAGHVPPRLESIDKFRVGPDMCTECGRYQQRTWRPGDYLVAPGHGFGYVRQTPTFRRIVTLAQIGVERGDPINYASSLFLDPIADERGVRRPRSMLVLDTVGDMNVPISAGNAFARAAGILPFLPPDAPDVYAEWRAEPWMQERWGDTTPLDVLVRYHVLEGIARLARHPGRTDPDTLFDADDLDEGAQGFGEQNLDPPMRLVRRSDTLASGVDPWGFGADRIDGTEPVSGLLQAYIEPHGVHAISEPIDPSEPFDDGVYYMNLIARYFASEGQDLYYRSHPDSHHCLEDMSCPEIRQPSTGGE